MKKALIYLTIILSFAIIPSCESTFLQVPSVTGSVGIEDIYSTQDNAVQALMTCYRNTLGLAMGLQYVPWSMYSGEMCKGQPFDTNFRYAEIGAQPTATGTVLNLNSIYAAIRSNFLVLENIDKVSDMDDANKSYVKAEAQGLIGYCYALLFKTYGGMPLIKRSLTVGDDLNTPRSSVQETLDYTIGLFDNSIAGLPNTWEDKFNGRLTKGAVMAMKAQMQLFAARPLFNSATPYIEAGANNKLICMGNSDAKRWDDVITSSEAAVKWVTDNGKGILNTAGGKDIPNANAFDDYATATSVQNNNELLLAYKMDENSVGYRFNASHNSSTNKFHVWYGIPRVQLARYYKNDGTEQSWPKAGDATPRPGSDYVSRFAEMEARFRADFLGPGVDAANNPGIRSWTAASWANYANGKDFLSNCLSVFPYGTTGKGCALSTKFYYKAGTRVWFEFPLIRVAELYLNLAEAYNEVGNSEKALENLNIVHNRAGLPSITETDKTTLRSIIQREWAIEFFHETKRYFDGRHWKLADIGNGEMYGTIEEFQFKVTSKSLGKVDAANNLEEYWSAVTYASYWDPKMYLDPIYTSEINKGVMVQNPGY